MKKKVLACVLVCVVVLLSAFSTLAVGSISAEKAHISGATDANGHYLKVIVHETEKAITQEDLSSLGVSGYNVVMCVDIKVIGDGDISTIQWPVTVTFDDYFDEILHWNGSAWEKVGTGNTAVFYSLSPVAFLKKTSGGGTDKNGIRDGNKDTSPKTGETSDNSLMYVIAIAAILLAGAGMIITYPFGKNLE